MEESVEALEREISIYKDMIRERITIKLCDCAVYGALGPPIHTIQFTLPPTHTIGCGCEDNLFMFIIVLNPG